VFIGYELEYSDSVNLPVSGGTHKCHFLVRMILSRPPIPSREVLLTSMDIVVSEGV